MPIPKRIFTIWIAEKEMPELMRECCETHNLSEYEHRTITLDNCFKDSRYLQEAIKAEKWIKVTDYLRIYYLYTEGGIYLDCDMEVLRPFDNLLNNDMFVCRENDRLIANSIIGAKEEHPLLKEYLEKVENNFKGDGELIFEPAERLFTDLINGVYGRFGSTTTYSSDYFHPLDEVTGKEKITDNTYTYHYFKRSWKNKVKAKNKSKITIHI